ncbi:MAG: hypothetical protein ACRDLF_05970 [Solirubrobacteraceae bacterium]
MLAPVLGSAGELHCGSAGSRSALVGAFDGDPREVELFDDDRRELDTSLAQLRVADGSAAAAAQSVDDDRLLALELARIER